MLNRVFLFFRRLSIAERAFVRFLREILGYTPGRTDLFHEAFRHKSAVEHCNRVSNERLEFLGDSVIELVVRQYLYKRFPEMSEGELTSIRIRIVNREFLNDIGRDMELDRYLELGEENKDRLLEQAPSLYGNTLEALTGAVFIDRGFAAAYCFFIEKVLNRVDDLDRLLFTHTDYKSRLIEWAQKYDNQVFFKVKNNPVRDDIFIVELSINGSKVSEGSGKRKKKAENDAARVAFEMGIPESMQP